MIKYFTMLNQRSVLKIDFIIMLVFILSGLLSDVFFVDHSWHYCPYLAYYIYLLFMFVYNFSKSIFAIKYSIKFIKKNGLNIELKYFIMPCVVFVTFLITIVTNFNIIYYIETCINFADWNIRGYGTTPDRAFDGSIMQRYIINFLNIFYFISTNSIYLIFSGTSMLALMYYYINNKYLSNKHIY